MTAAIYYHPEAFSTTGPTLMGRNAAGESFLRGFLTHGTADEFWVQAQHASHAQQFAQTAAVFNRKPVKAVFNTALGALAQAGTLYYPGPEIGEQAFLRAGYGHAAWSLCGVTHTTSSARAMGALADLLTSPVQPWDALICTSTAVKDNVQRLLQAQVDYLKDRLGISKLVLPQLPVIPLGIHTRDFAYTDTQKAAARAALGADEGTLVVLFVGRLSFHAKAHPLAMYQALQAATLQTGKPLLLVECGWHAHDSLEQAFADAARLACPSVRTLTLDGRKAEDRLTAWAGADVFCSLSDNIQETFGIAPIEAMAAGLPVVVSDWDGYKDTVRDGMDGFRIPTWMPSAGMGIDLALRHAQGVDDYDMYCGHACSLVAVDVQATAQAFVRLLESPGLRRQMGEAGRTRARQAYDWATVIPQYEALWAQLAHLRKTSAKDLKPLPQPWPARMDPFYAFAGYPTHSLTPQTLLALADADAQTALSRVQSYRPLVMVDFARAVLPSEDDIRAVLALAATAPRTASELVSGIPAERQPFVMRSLAWLLKLGVLKVLPPAPQPGPQASG